MDECSAKVRVQCKNSRKKEDVQRQSKRELKRYEQQVYQGEGGGRYCRVDLEKSSGRRIKQRGLEASVRCHLR